ncbi:benenodin family lasso peptide [Sphingomonas hengshuiensis]|jgi:hypothetical protein|nr:benenodin family lasso peptide [Sphingomonas hengshuiensis]
MNREHEDTIELGVVSTDTKGLIVGGPDADNGQLAPFGLSDD